MCGDNLRLEEVLQLGITHLFVGGTWIAEGIWYRSSADEVRFQSSCLVLDLSMPLNAAWSHESILHLPAVDRLVLRAKSHVCSWRLLSAVREGCDSDHRRGSSGGRMPSLFFGFSDWGDSRNRQGQLTGNFRAQQWCSNCRSGSRPCPPPNRFRFQAQVKAGSFWWRTKPVFEVYFFYVHIFPSKLRLELEFKKGVYNGKIPTRINDVDENTHEVWWTCCDCHV